MCRRQITWIALALALALTLPAGPVLAKLVAYYPMNEGDGTLVADASGNGHDGAAQGTVTWVDGPPGFGKAILYDGSNPAKGWVNCGTWNPSAGTGQLTVAFWVMYQGTNANWQGLVGKRDGYDPATAPPMMWYIEANQGSGVVSFGCRNRTFTGAGVMPKGVWTHLAVTFDGTTATTYVNGEPNGSGSFSFGDKLDSVITIGCDEGSGYNGFNGAIDEVRFYDTALTQGGVQQLMNADLSGSSEPSPKDAAQDVARDPLLTWTRGQRAVAHDVYFGAGFNDVSAATRTSPLGVLLSQGQAATSCSVPGLLALGQTYFWRVDEVNAPPDSSIKRGQVWSFTAEPIGYVVKPAKATASTSYITSMGPEKTIDGSGIDANDDHSTVATQMWLSKKNQSPVWIQYEFDAAYKLYQMWVWNSNQPVEPLTGFGAKDVSVTYSTDGTTWTTLDGVPEFAQATGEPNYAHNTTVDFDGVLAKYVKLTIASNWADGTKQAGLSEVRFFYIPVRARYPEPASGTSGVAVNGVLNWRPGREAARHEVSISTDPNAVRAGTAPVKTVTDHRLGLADLGVEYGRTYSWKVNEVNDAATPASWTSDVWSFSTVAYGVVDDFESYDDKCNRIFFSWVDGFGYSASADCSVAASNGNGTGSTVGNVQAPFAEHTVVHSGSQSMPMEFDNTKAPYYSEAQRDWASPQVWTGGGADTLVVYLRGDPQPFQEISPGTIRMGGAGTDIWGNSDQFRLAYKQLKGNGSIIARVDRVGNTNAWAKAGVMIRETLQSGSTHALMVVTPGSGASFQRRITTDDVSANTDVSGVKAPYWVKLTRTGSSFTAQISADGVTWADVTVSPAISITMANDVYIGLAVTSHTADVVCGAEFSNISTTGSVTGAWQVAEIGVPQPAGNSPETFYVTVRDSAGNSKVVSHPDPGVIATGDWEQWNIPLSPFTSAGVNLGAIRQMVVGVGNRRAPKAGGAGKVYIDDIQLTRIATP